MLSRRRLLFMGSVAGGAAAAPGMAVSAAATNRGWREPVDMRGFGAAGDGRRDDADALNAAVRKAVADARVTGAGAAIRLQRGRYRLARDLWVPPEVSVAFDPGAVVAPDAGTVFTIHAQVLAGAQHVFAGSGTVRLAQPGPVSVLWFGAEDGRESTEAFRRAIRAVTWGRTVVWRQGRGTIEVPPTRKGFVVKDLRLPSGIRLRGAGANGSVLLNDGADGQPTLVVGYTDGTVIRDVRIEGLYLQGNPGCGDGIVFEGHAYNEVLDCVVRGHGGHGIVARKTRSTMSDSLSLTDVTALENRRVGLRIGLNSHGCAAHNCVFVNNAAGNVVAEGTYFNMWGGQVNGVDGADGIRLAHVNCGGLWGVGFEATPAVRRKTTLLHLDGARAVVVAGCDFTSSGNSGDCTCIAADHAHDCTLISPMFDANSDGTVVGISVSAACRNLQVVSPRFGSNHGRGGFVDMENASATTALQTGHGRPLLPSFVATAPRDIRLEAVAGGVAAPAFEQVDHGSALAVFDPATGRFTAPMDGLYHFDAQLRFAGPAAPEVRLNTGKELIPGIGGAGLGVLSASIRLARGQAVTLELVGPGGGGPITLRAGARFSGHLVA